MGGDEIEWHHQESTFNQACQEIGANLLALHADRDGLLSHRDPAEKSGT
jgi:hypothetical protein